MTEKDKWIFTVFITAVLLIGVTALNVYDTWVHFKTFIQNEHMALAYAALIPLSICFLMLVKGLSIYMQGFTVILILALEFCMLWASSMAFTAPLYEHKLTAQNQMILDGYRDQRADYRDGISTYKTALLNLKSQPINSVNVKNKINGLQAKLDAVNLKIESILKTPGGNETQIAKSSQNQAIIFRTCTGLIFFVLSGVLRILCPIQLKPYNAGTVKHDIDESANDYDLSDLGDKAFVKKYFPDAECSGKKGGNYAVYSEGKMYGDVLGRGKNSRPAWQNARRLIERKVA